jgi:hypothetical protein
MVAKARPASKKPAKSAAAKAPAKKPAAKAVAKKPAKPPLVALVGAHGAGVSALFQRLVEDATHEAPEKPRSAPWTVAKGRDVLLVDVPGLFGQDDQTASAWRRVTSLEKPLEHVQVVIHVLGAWLEKCDDRAGDAEWGLSAFGDIAPEAARLYVLHGADSVDESDQVLALRARFPDLIEFSSDPDDHGGVKALAKRVAQALDGRLPLHPVPAEVVEAQRDVDRLSGCSMLDLQYQLLARTSVGKLDGSVLLADLEDFRFPVAALVVQRSPLTVYAPKDNSAERQAGGLRGLAGLVDNAHDADEVQVLLGGAHPAESAQELLKHAKKKWSPTEAELDEATVTLRWTGDRNPVEMPADATSVQAIELELIRRSRYNDLNGQRVWFDLATRPLLWKAALLGRQTIRAREGKKLSADPTAGVLLDGMLQEEWAADTLWLLAPDEETALELARLGQHWWWADTVAIYDAEEAERLAGVESPQRIVEFWWD